MGIFSKSSPTSAIPERRKDALTTPIKTPSESTTPVTVELTEEQANQYDALLSYITSNEHGQTFTDLEQMYLSKDQLLRFCRATKWDLAKTKTRILATLKWRRDYGVDKITAEHVEPEAKTGKQVILGFDNSQRPCLYLFPGRQNTEVSPRQVQYLVWSLERIIELMPPDVENIALLVNYKGSTGDKNPGIGQGREVLNILQTHYVETLGRALVINIPFFVWGFFKLITPFIDPLTREKLKFNEDMTQHVPKSQLDSEFGGDVVFDYVHEEYWPALVSMCTAARENKIKNWKALGGGIGQSETAMKRSEQKQATPTVPGDHSVQGGTEGDKIVTEANHPNPSSQPVEAVYIQDPEPVVARQGYELGDVPRG